ncbi:MAG: Asp-tRNA(Asn)/Glu-tRNA(Gln) amidotransferase subunit GatC [Clostridiales bacterium]|nr:Asp-tRNA(Asn)/Glu-tRNA(Gln) amidotransferase subunit GatC [Clostridiales bacterium]
MSEISEETAEYAARLARLSLDGADKEKIVSDLAEFVRYMDVLNKADTAQIEAESHISGLVNVFREDVAEEEHFDREKLLLNAPERTADSLIVPKTLE